MNKVILIGRLGRDPELRKTQSGNSNVSFTVAVDRQYTGQDGKRATDWISCVAWRNTAEFIAKYFSKGSRIAITGSIQTRTYEAQDGSKRTVTEVVCESVEFVESKNKTDSTDNKQPETRSFTEVDDDELPF